MIKLDKNNPFKKALRYRLAYVALSIALGKNTYKKLAKIKGTTGSTLLQNHLPLLKKSKLIDVKGRIFSGTYKFNWEEFFKYCKRLILEDVEFRKKEIGQLFENDNYFENYKNFLDRGFDDLSKKDLKEKWENIFKHKFKNILVKDDIRDLEKISFSDLIKKLLSEIGQEYFLFIQSAYSNPYDMFESAFKGHDIKIRLKRKLLKMDRFEEILAHYSIIKTNMIKSISLMKPVLKYN